MLKFTGIFLLLIVLSFSVTAQKNTREKISGIVKTTDGHPAEYIHVLLKNTPYGTATDTKGYFEFTAPAGNYTLVVHSIYAHRVELPVTIKSDTENKFPGITIRENVNQLEAVVVTGQFSPQSMRNSLYKVRTINSQQIRQKAATSVQSLLNTEIGIRLSNDMALGETDFELMGMSGNNVKILLDGVPLIDRGATRQSLSQIDVNTIERIEIVEGPMSVVYGTDALAGVINIITKKGGEISDESTWNIGARIQEETAGNEYQAFRGDGTHNESVDLGFNHKSGMFLNGGFTRNNTGGWTGDLTGREKRWQPKNQNIYNGILGYKKKNLSVWYRLDFLNEKIFNASNGSDIKPEEVSDKNFITKRFTHQVQSNWKLDNKLDVNLVASYQDYRRRTQTTVSNTLTGEKWLSIEEAGQDTTSYKAWIARGTVSWNVSPKLSLQPGIEYQRNQGDGGRIEGKPVVSELAAFLSAEWKPAEWVSVRPGVRMFIAADYDAPLAIPSLLTKFSLNHRMDIRLSYAYGFRAPTLQELYFSFHNANHNIDGNPDLKAEYSNNVTGSFTWRILHNEAIRLTTTISGFYNDFRDRITTADNVDIPNHTTYYNIDRYKTAGGSWENTLNWKNLQANLNFSLTGRYNRYSEDDKDLPAFRFSPEVSSSITYRLAASGTDFNLYYKFTGERKEYYYQTTTGADGVKYNEVYLKGLKSYNWADLTITQKITRYLNLNAGVKNIFGLTKISTVADSADDTTPVSYLGCGRSWFLGLSFSLNGKI